jgi:uncharacterized membrane protein
MQFNQPVLSFNVTLLSETIQNLLIVDENNLPLEHIINGDVAAIYNIGSTKIVLSYLTQNLTTKAGPYWTITTDYPESIELVLPQNASIISINTVPDLIENLNGSLKLTMPNGLTEIIYTTSHTLADQNAISSSNNSEQWLLAAAAVIVIIILLTLTGVWLQKRKKITKPKLKKEEKQEVDLEKILNKNRELRQDETQVIKYLANKNGKAFEAELFELLNLPRTTTWRLIRRLEGLEIVHIKKSRRQNIVLIRDKYLKKH